MKPRTVAQLVRRWRGAPVDPPQYARFGAVLVQTWTDCLGCGGWYRSSIAPRCRCTDKP